MADSERSGGGIIGAKETFRLLQEMSTLLNTGLDSETLAICIRLCEKGANPEALASVVRDLRRESASAKSSSEK